MGDKFVLNEQRTWQQPGMKSDPEFTSSLLCDLGQYSHLTCNGVGRANPQGEINAILHIELLAQNKGSMKGMVVTVFIAKY